MRFRDVWLLQFGQIETDWLTNVSRPPAARSRSAFNYHCEEDSKLRVHINHVPVGEDKLLLLVLLALKDDVDLLGGDRQNRQLDAVELIKAAPGSGLSQTWKDTHFINENLPTSSTCTPPSFMQMVGPLGGSTENFVLKKVSDLCGLMANCRPVGAS